MFPKIGWIDNPCSWCYDTFVSQTKEPKTDRENLAALVDMIEMIVPYVTATLSTGNRFPGKMPDWVEISKGRCISSERQLEQLLKLAKEMRP